MKNLKKQPAKQLEKFSNIFTQLGLVLVLFIVYVTLEYKTAEKPLTTVVDYDVTEKVIIEPNQIIKFTREPKLEPKAEIAKATFLIPDEVVKGNNDIVEKDFLDEPMEDIVQVDPEDIIEVDIPVDEGPETVAFISIQNAPVFKGCEGLSKEENKKCFDQKMLKFVRKNFDAELANEVGLRSGKYKIQTQFIIDKEGNVVDIQIRAPHKRLQKETQQLIEKLPQFTPGKQSNKPVKVRYTLPISFQVE